MSSKEATARVFFFFFVKLVALISYYERDLIIIERDEIYIPIQGQISKSIELIKENLKYTLIWTRHSIMTRTIEKSILK